MYYTVFFSVYSYGNFCLQIRMHIPNKKIKNSAPENMHFMCTYECKHMYTCIHTVDG